MSYHELEAENARLRGLLAVELEKNKALAADAEKAWSKLNWKEHECDDLRAKMKTAPEQESLPSIDALIKETLKCANYDLKIDCDKWILVSGSIEHCGPSDRYDLSGRTIPPKLSLRIDTGTSAFSIEAHGVRDWCEVSQAPSPPQSNPPGPAQAPAPGKTAPPR